MRHFGIVIWLLALTGIAGAQAVVTPWNTATSWGAAVPAAPPSPPLLYAPIVHLGDGPTSPAPPAVVPQPTQISAPLVIMPGFVTAESDLQTAGMDLPAARSLRREFEFGAAQFNNAYELGLGRENRSLAEIATEMRQHKPKQPVRIYTNADIDRVSREWGAIPRAPEETPNGVIVPPGAGMAQPQPAPSQPPVISPPASAPPPKPNSPARRSQPRITPVSFPLWNMALNRRF